MTVATRSVESLESIDITKLKPKALGRWVLVYQFPPEVVTKSGLLLPPVAQKAPQLGRVISVGAHVKVDVKEGDLVTFPDFAGTEQVLGDLRKYLVLAQEDLYSAFTIEDSDVVQPLDDRLGSDERPRRRRS